MDSLLHDMNSNEGVPTLGKAFLERVPVPVPPVTEQGEIARQVEALFAVADTIESRLQAATARAEKLPQAILSKAFSGDLVPTEADLARAEGRTYETAEELLARVPRETGHGPGRARRGRTDRRETT